MLGWLYRACRPTERKARLFGCACLRAAWDRLPEPARRRAVAMAERFADGLASEEERLAALRAAWEDADSLPGVHHPLDFFDRDPVLLVCDPAVGVDPVAIAYCLTDTAAGRREQAALLRDLSGPLPFRPVTVPPAVLQWQEGLVVRLARASYDERQLPAGTLEPERLAVLADALEDAGCSDADRLGHLRGRGPHVRGCWPVDMLTGRE
jgi:hypothetical protein